MGVIPMLQFVSKGESLLRMAYEAIQERIISGSLPPDSLLSERELANELSISRTPIKAALRLLEQNGYVRTMPFKGVIVRKISLKELEEITLIRLQLETAAVRLAVEKCDEGGYKHLQRLLNIMADAYLFPLKTDGEDERPGRLNFFQADDKFHQTICRIAGSPRIEEILTPLFGHFHRVRILCERERVIETHEEHTKIYKAFETKDPDEAEARMREHIQRAQNHILSVLQRERPDCFEV
jgi:DNA-binding GntR family transcriptional regulator